MARWIPLAIDPFIDLGAVLIAGMEQSDECDDETLFLYDDILQLRLTIEAVLSALEAELHQMGRFIKKLEAAVNSAKTDDTSSLKKDIIKYLMEKTDEEIKPRIPTGGLKVYRGFTNPVTARHLCPSKMLQKFDADPEAFMDKVSQGLVKIKAGLDWPSFLYDIATMDPVDPRKGFLRGYLLVQTFTVPLVSTGNRNATKPPKAHIHDLTKVTGRTIAYMATQAQFAISSCEKWAIIVGNFNLQKFYNNIVRIFEECPKDPYVVELLLWWNEQVPGLIPTNKRKRGRKHQDGADDSSDDEAVKEMLGLLWGGGAQQV
ncbi:hypothetical protein DXG01_015939 [Tephrocybe rancida]|nr:hypothetical protein DXG01_015939 [Tephrocybe rancida]